ncbi:MAG: PIG-L family deacetylase [Chloroflexi bacterium]|nr:PIG-L family deacetylase [Chloroflexota bacterium]
MTKQINVIIFVAHPDEAEEYTGGTAALFAEMGHAVKFVSLTNGDAGHFDAERPALAERRLAEAHEAGRILGVEYTVLDHSDGELQATIEVRKEVIRLAREWQADVVIGFHPTGGTHADNRTAGEAVRDAATFIASVPLLAPEAPALRKSPLFLLVPDYHTKQFYRPHIAIDVDRVIDKKVASIGAHESQIYEFGPWQRGILDQVPEDPAERKEFLWSQRESYFDPVKDRPELAPVLEKWYGPEKAKTIQYAEAFEIAGYGDYPDDDEIRALFPMLPAKP